MDLTLTRKEFRPDGVFGVLTDSDGNVIAHTLEHSYNDQPKIPDGVFTCVRGEHQLHNGVPFETFEICGVPGHKGLLFHAGNFNKDSEGCVLVGEAEQGEMITNSRATFAKLMDLQSGIQTFQLTVTRKMT